jgi:phosphoribosyl 1,2-cyclic phosphate phosphodiesterase
VRVTLLGTGTSTGVPVPTCTCATCRSDDPHDRRWRCSALIEWDGATVLIDTSTDLRAQALAHRIERIDAVLYTHAHADHVLGLDELRMFNWRQGGPVPAYGNPATLAAVARTFWYVFDEAPSEHTRPAIELRPVTGPFELCGREVVPVPVIHGRLPILGYRLGRFAYLTDVSAIPDTSLPLLADLDVLVLSALRHRPHPAHLTIEAAVEQARAIGAGHTYLTHLSHEVHHATHAARLPAGIELAHDGLRIEVANDR